MIRIETLNNTDQATVRAFILTIQNEEFGLGFKEKDQPDLVDIKNYYKNGEFWVAKIADYLVGTIALEKLDSQNGILRKLFVKQEFRGKQYNIGQLLFNQLKNKAIQDGLSTLFLDTPSVAVASHKFYQRNGFEEINKLDIPMGYLYPDRNSKLFKLILNH